MNVSDSIGELRAPSTPHHVESVKYFGNERIEALRYKSASPARARKVVTCETRWGSQHVQAAIFAVTVRCSCGAPPTGIVHGRARWATGDCDACSSSFTSAQLTRRALRVIKQSLTDMEKMFRCSR